MKGKKAKNDTKFMDFGIIYAIQKKILYRTCSTVQCTVDILLLKSNNLIGSDLTMTVHYRLPKNTILNALTVLLIESYVIKQCFSFHNF